MRITQTALRAGIAATAAIGFTGIAAAQTPQTHVMTLALPGGGVAQIQYAGTVAPRVYISDVPAPTSALFDADSPFAEMARLSAAMNRQAARMLEVAAALSAQPAAVSPAAAAAMPPGSRQYSFVATMNGNGVCSRSVEIISQGSGEPPKVIRHTSGDCDAAGGLLVQTQWQPAPIQNEGSQLIMTKAVGARPYAGRIEEAALR